MRSLAVLLILCVTTVLAAEEVAPRSLHLRERMKQEFHFDPAANADQEARSRELEDDVVILPQFNVVGPRRGLDRAVAEARLRAGEEHFTWKHGGTILKLGNKVEIKFKYNPDHNGIDLLNWSW